MVSTRRRSSMPPPERQSTSCNKTSDISAYFTTTTSRTSSSPDVPAQRVARLDERAAELASMTSELHLRMLGNEVRKMEKDVEALVHKTADDEKFRAKNEEMMQNIWTEMMSVKQQAASLGSTQTDLTEDFKKLQEETTNLVEEYRFEVETLKTDLREVTTKMNTHAVCLGSFDDSGYESLGREMSFGEYGDHKRLLQKSTPRKDQDMILPQSTTPEDNQEVKERSIEDRIRETIQSTKRWHREHKGTELNDAVFCANYLKQQSKRDAEIAVLIQKSVSKRVRERLGQQHSRPSSIEEFCTNVTWQDIMEIAQTVLVNNVQSTSAELAGKRG